MTQPKITLYYDIVSPFGYMVFYALENFPVFKQCDINYVPVLLGGIFKACGNQAPIAIKNKSTWINHSRNRWAAQFSIPIASTPPPDFPVQTLHVQRMLASLAASPNSKEFLAPCTAALWKAFWGERNSDAIRDPATTVKVLAGVLGEERARQLVEVEGKSAEAKAFLAKKTEEAVEKGAFGVPHLEVTNADGETDYFWGFDELGLVLAHLKLQKPAEGGWKAMM